MFYLKAFLGFIVAFLVLDAAWIKWVVVPLYLEELGDLVRQPANAKVGVIFYLFYASISIALCREAINETSLTPALLDGALVGAATYGTYALTNYAVLEGWTLTLVLSDIAWGIIITSICVLVARLSSRIGGAN